MGFSSVSFLTFGCMDSGLLVLVSQMGIFLFNRLFTGIDGGSVLRELYHMYLEGPTPS